MYDYFSPTDKSTQPEPTTTVASLPKLSTTVSDQTTAASLEAVSAPPIPTVQISANNQPIKTGDFLCVIF